MLLAEAQALWPASVMSSIAEEYPKAATPSRLHRLSVPGSRLLDSLSPCFELHDQRADYEALRQLALWCQRYGPLTAIEEADLADSIFLDITGCGYGFGGEAGLAWQAAAALRELGYWAVITVADTAGAAWALAHFGRSLERGATGGVRIVPPGRHEEALRPLPVEALRLSAETVRLLHDFNIRRIEQVLNLPRAAMPARFGAELLRRLDQALGAIAELLTPERRLEPIELSCLLEPPTAERRRVEQALEHLLQQLLERLQPQHLGVQRLSCTITIAAHDPERFAVELLQPSASLRHLMDLARLHLERIIIPAEASGVTLLAALIVPLELRQDYLFEGDGHRSRLKHLASLLERLSSRLGERAVLRPQLCPDPQPEYAYAYADWVRAKDSSSRTRSEPSSDVFMGRPRAPLNEQDAAPVQPTCGIPPKFFSLRPPWLASRPAPLLATSLVPNGPPLQFHWRGRHYVVTHCWGPERIETGWWRGDDIRRDYYLVETAAGDRFWLFRRLADGTWFLHGVYA